MNIALKEANETDYWLDLLKDTEFITATQFESLSPDCKELIAMLVSTVKTAKGTRICGRSENKRARSRN